MTTKEKLIATLGVDDRKMMLFAIPILAFLVPLLFFKKSLSDGLIAYLPEFATSLMYTTVYWFSLRAVFITMRRRFPYYEETRKRLLYTTIATIGVFLVADKVLDWIHHATGEHEDINGVTETDFFIASFTLAILVSVVYESIFLYARWKETVIETERLRRENVESQLEGLRNQVNPHFLFNSLNTLTYLIPEDPQKAVQFVQMLSKVYRYILEIRDKKLIHLEEELQFLEAYNFLLKERFGENLQIDLNIPDVIKNQQIVPLSLQILFENAIKHNIISSDKPLKIEVFTEKEHLVIQNNLQKKKQTMPSTKVGLENIRNRYAFFSAEPVQVFSDDAYFRVHLPLLKNALSLLDHKV